MSSSAGGDDAAGGQGKRESPPLRFGCFGPRFWKKRKASLSSSTSATAAGAGCSAPDLTVLTGLSSRAQVEGPFSQSNVPTTGTVTAMDEGNVPEEGYSFPQTQTILGTGRNTDERKTGEEGSSSSSTEMMLATGMSTGEVKMQEEVYSSPQQEIIMPTGTTADERKTGEEGSSPSSTEIALATGISTDELKIQEEVYSFPQKETIMPTGTTADDDKEKEEDCHSPSTQLFSAASRYADARRMKARQLSWDEVCHVVYHLVLRHIPSYYDRQRLSAVSHQWREATCLHPLTPLPLPLVVTADFSMINCFADGPLASPRAIKLSGQFWNAQTTACVGSFEDWIVCVYPRPWDPSKSVLLSDQHCYIIDPSRQKSVLLPDPPGFEKGRRLHGVIQVENTNSVISYAQPSISLDITLSKVVLTTSPDVVSFKAAAISERRGRHHLALSMMLMESWCIYTADFITPGTDLEFFDGLLYLLRNDSGDLFILDFRPQFCFFPVATRAERCLMDQIPDSSNHGLHTCNLVRLNTELVLVVRKFAGIAERMHDVQVYVLDNKTTPWKWITMNTLHGYSILISSSHNAAYPAHLYDEIEEETIYLLDSMTPEYLPREDEKFTYRVLLYNIQDKMIGVRLIGNKPSGVGTKFPMWFCPTH